MSNDPLRNLIKDLMGHTFQVETYTDPAGEERVAGMILIQDEPGRLHYPDAIDTTIVEEDQ